jgi:hypothetical protein
MIPTIIDGLYRLYPDGRQKLLATRKGKIEYIRRREAMAHRQGWICGCGCGLPMRVTSGFIESVTFQHDELRGKDRDDRIEDSEGKPINCAMRYGCNVARGSQRA